MARTETPDCEAGMQAPDFALSDTSGQRVSLADVRGENGTLVMFICNHCPYVKAILPRLIDACRTLSAEGIGCAAIMSNDPTDYPEDSPENMARLARDMDFPFPYLLDESQDVAKAYGAVCTPDFFGFDRDLKLRYRGRLDAGVREEPPPGAPRELVEAMRKIAAGEAPEEQVPSIGCSIKWRAA